MAGTASALAVLSFGALAAAAACAWVARAYARAGGRPGTTALGACAGAAIAVLGLYLMIGKPTASGAPHAERLEMLRDRVKAGGAAQLSLEEQLALLQQRTREAPDDAIAQRLSGRVLAALGRDFEAARAFQASLRREPNDAPTLLDLARASLRLNQGAMTPETLALFERAAELDPSDPAGWLYQAIAATEAGRHQDAERLWGETLARLPERDPRREMAARMQDAARQSRAPAGGKG